LANNPQQAINQNLKNNQQNKQSTKISRNTEKLTFVMLNGKNYHLWARQATFDLIGRDKLEHVNGENPIPVPKVSGDPTEEEKSAIKEWRKNDNHTYSWLIPTMEPHVADIISYQNTTKQM
jgi:hypothetical protein